MDYNWEYIRFIERKKMPEKGTGKSVEDAGNMPIYERVADIPPKLGYFIISDSHAENLNLSSQYQVGVKFRKNQIKVYYQIPIDEINQQIERNPHLTQEAVLNVAAQITSNNIVGAANMLAESLQAIQKQWGEIISDKTNDKKCRDCMEKIREIRVTMNLWLNQLTVAGGLPNQIIGLKEIIQIASETVDYAYDFGDITKRQQEDANQQIGNAKKMIEIMQQVSMWTQQLLVKIDAYFNDFDKSSLPGQSDSFIQSVGRQNTICLDLIAWIMRYYEENFPKPIVEEE